MKRYGDLFRWISHPVNLTVAHMHARRGKAHYADVQAVDEEPWLHLERLHQMLIDQTFTTSAYRIKQVYEPKKRTIYVLPYFPDRIVHHAVMQIIQPIWDRVFIYDVYSAIPGRGIHKAIHRLDDFLEDERNTRYCLQFDIKKFYPSVWHDILLELVQRKIKCKKTLWLLEDIIRSPGGKTNIPIGNYLSQYFANIYLNWFDHWLKEEKHVMYYIRYGDDGIVLDYSKQFLHELLAEIRQYLHDNLRLELNARTRIYPVDRQGIDFLGYRTYRDFRLLRTSSAKRFKSKAQGIRREHDRMPAQHIVSSIMSYVGWLQHGDCYNLLREHVLDDAEMTSILNDACRELEIDNPLLKKYPGAVRCRNSAGL